MTGNTGKEGVGISPEDVALYSEKFPKLSPEEIQDVIVSYLEGLDGNHIMIFVPIFIEKKLHERNMQKQLTDLNEEFVKQIFPDQLTAQPQEPSEQFQIRDTLLPKVLKTIRGVIFRG